MTMPPDGLRTLIQALADVGRRQPAADAIAAAAGLGAFHLYVRDAEVDAMVPAPGMRKTVRAGPRWAELLDRCHRQAEARGHADFDGQPVQPALALVEQGCAAIFVGECPAAFVQQFGDYFPILAAAVRAQHDHHVASAAARDAREAAGRAHELARALDAARAAAAELNAQLSAEHRRKDEFLAMLAHELRNPLAPIANAVHLLARVRPPTAEAVDRQVAVMTRQVRQLTHLVDDLLDVSRVSRGLIELRREVLPMRDVLSAAVESVQPLLESRRHTVRHVGDAGGVFVAGDRVRLVQVFSNLLTNAAKYTDPGGEIEIAVTGDPAHARVRITDNGAGIPREMLASIFDMFTQVPASLDRAPGGLGIGLTLVRSLVELHGGEVSARSDGPGRGSTFEVQLPRTAAPQVPSERQPASLETLAGLRVLVVDDNTDAAESLGEVLRIMGAQLEIACDGAQALRAAEAGPLPDLVLLDIGLPGMDGYETAREWRRRFGTATRLVALTGYGSPEDKRRTAQAGFSAHLVKPVDLDTIHRLLQEPATGP